MSDTIPEWAKVEAGKRCGQPSMNNWVWGEWTPIHQLAIMIAKHEKEPVDPLLLEAREIAAKAYNRAGKAYYAEQTRSSAFDDGFTVQLTLAALRRGIEIGKGDS